MIEIPFGAKDSELMGWRYTIPEGYTAEIKDGEIIVKQAESEDEKIRKFLVRLCERCSENSTDFMGDIKKADVLAYLEKQKDSPMPEDTVIFQKGVAEGRRLEREDMEKGRLNVPGWRRAEEEMFTDDFSDNFFIKQSHTNLYRANDVHKGELYLRVKDVEDLLDNLPYPSNYKRKKKVGRSNKGQKPEWGEGDEKMLVAISKALGCDTAEKILVNEGVTLVMAASFLESLKNRGNSPESNANSPSWKPSEEQMEFLSSTIDVLRKGGHAFFAENLESIREELRKLI